MSNYTKEQLHKLYRDLVINRSTRPMTTKELRDNTSYINEDWEEAFDNRQLTPEQEDKAIAIRYNYPRDTKTAAFDALNTLFGDLQDALYTKSNGIREIKDKSDVIRITKDENGNDINLPPIYKQPLIDIIKASKKVKGMTPEKAIALSYNESTLGVNPSRYGYLGGKNATKKDVTDAMNYNIENYKESTTYTPDQLVGLDHPDRKGKVDYIKILTKFIPEPKPGEKRIDYITIHNDAYGGEQYRLTPEGKEYFVNYLKERFKDNKIPDTIISNLNKAQKFVEKFEPFENALEYFQENPKMYNSDSYSKYDNGSDLTKYSEAIQKGLRVIENNPELKALIEKYK